MDYRKGNLCTMQFMSSQRVIMMNNRNLLSHCFVFDQSLTWLGDLYDMVYVDVKKKTKNELRETN